MPVFQTEQGIFQDFSTGRYGGKGCGLWALESILIQTRMTGYFFNETRHSLRLRTIPLPSQGTT